MNRAYIIFERADGFHFCVRGMGFYDLAERGLRSRGEARAAAIRWIGEHPVCGNAPMMGPGVPAEPSTPKESFVSTVEEMPRKVFRRCKSSWKAAPARILHRSGREGGERSKFL